MAKEMLVDTHHYLLCLYPAMHIACSYINSPIDFNNIQSQNQTPKLLSESIGNNSIYYRAQKSYYKAIGISDVQYVICRHLENVL